MVSEFGVYLAILKFGKLHSTQVDVNAAGGDLHSHSKLLQDAQRCRQSWSSGVFFRPSGARDGKRVKDNQRYQTHSDIQTFFFGPLGRFSEGRKQKFPTTEQCLVKGLCAGIGSLIAGAVNIADESDAIFRFVFCDDFWVDPWWSRGIIWKT